jgi:hypothetical protein
MSAVVFTCFLWLPGRQSAPIPPYARGGWLAKLGAATRTSQAVGAARAHELPEHIELAAYFAVSESLTNAGKYAGANAIRTRVEREHGEQAGMNGLRPAMVLGTYSGGMF